MTVRVTSRQMWQDPTQPVTGPGRRAPFQQGVVHWEGIDRDTTPANIAEWLRKLQAAYLTSRHYSLGYGFAVVSDVRHPDDGTLWEIRGFDLNMASNPGRKWADLEHTPTGNANDWTGSVLIIGPTGVPASAAAAASIRDLFETWHTTAGTSPVRPFPHSTLDYTACCGDAYRADLDAGRFDPQPKDDEMRYLSTPVRMFDSRQWGTKVAAGEHVMQLPDVLPGGLSALSVTVTAVEPDAAGYVTLWASGQRPLVSCLNYQAAPIANTTAVAVDGGTFRVYVKTATHLILDVIGTQ